MASLMPNTPCTDRRISQSRTPWGESKMDPRRLQDGPQIAPFFPISRPNPRTPESSLNQNPSSGGAFGKKHNNQMKTWGSC